MDRNFDRWIYLLLSRGKYLTKPVYLVPVQSHGGFCTVVRVALVVTPVQLTLGILTMDENCIFIWIRAEALTCSFLVKVIFFFASQLFLNMLNGPLN